MDSGIFGEGYHPQACAGALAVIDYGPAALADGAVDLCEGFHSSSIAHSDNRE